MSQHESQEHEPQPRGHRRHAFVTVLGDLGRSPRMCNHALSLADHDFHVNLIGYPGSNLPAEIREHTHIEVTHVQPYPKWLNENLPRMINYLFKVIWQACSLFVALISSWVNPEILILQNPPSIPAMLVCKFFTRVCTNGYCKLAVDWHNYGYTILSMAVGDTHPLVRFNAWFENNIGKKADLSFCVTKAMKADLAEKWGIEATTLYDRAPVHFRPRSLEEKHSLFLRLGKDYPEFSDPDEGRNCTAFTEEFASGVQLREDRPVMLVSSTSWTEDEDFSVLLEALSDYENAVAARDLPEMVCVITGKGPQKEYYKDLISKMEWRHVKVVTPWLEPEDYPLLLASADLGVCLHMSSSGLDLPMKVVDMFGCGLPVCAYKFPALPELVQHGRNGMVFRNSPELAEQLQGWFEGFPRGDSERRDAYRKRLEEFQKLKWEENWEKVALPQIEKAIEQVEE